MTTEKDNPGYSKNMEQVRLSFFKYAKILVFSFIWPLMFAAMINEGAVLWKMISWFQLKIEFWTLSKYYSPSLFIALIPLVYLFWFYYLLIKKVLLQLHEDFFKDWNIEIGNLMATSIIQLNEEGRQGKFDIEVVIVYLNRKLSQLPKWIEWIARKLVDQIPFVDFINSFDVKDLDNSNKENLSNSITNKVNEFELAAIQSIVPFWTKFIIPINIVFLLLYGQL